MVGPVSSAKGVVITSPMLRHEARFRRHGRWRSPSRRPLCCDPANPDQPEVPRAVDALARSLNLPGFAPGISGLLIEPGVQQPVIRRGAPRLIDACRVYSASHQVSLARRRDNSIVTDNLCPQPGAHLREVACCVARYRDHHASLDRSGVRHPLPRSSADESARTRPRCTPRDCSHRQKDARRCCRPMGRCTFGHSRIRNRGEHPAQGLSRSPGLVMTEFDRHPAVTPEELRNRLRTEWIAGPRRSGAASPDDQ